MGEVNGGRGEVEYGALVRGYLKCDGLSFCFFGTMKFPALDFRFFSAGWCAVHHSLTMMLMFRMQTDPDITVERKRFSHGRTMRVFLPRLQFLSRHTDLSLILSQVMPA